jgi:hypothetical protein
MTSRCVQNGPGHEWPGGLKEIIISCDHMTCLTALNDTQIRESGGLKQMGWTTAFDGTKLRHYCPDHPRN